MTAGWAPSGAVKSNPSGPGGCSLGWSEAQVAADFGEGSFDADDAFIGLVAVGVEGDEFTDAAAGVGGGDDEGSVSRVDGVSEVGDLGGGEEPFLGVLDLGQVDVTTRGSGDEPGCDRIVADPPEELAGVADRRRRITVGDKMSDPLLDVVQTDGTNRHGGEDGEHETSQIRLITGLSRVTTVSPFAGRLFSQIARDGSDRHVGRCSCLRACGPRR